MQTNFSFSYFFRAQSPANERRAWYERGHGPGQEEEHCADSPPGEEGAVGVADVLCDEPVAVYGDDDYVQDWSCTAEHVWGDP